MSEDRRSSDAVILEFATLKDAGEALGRNAASWLTAALTERNSAFVAVPGGKSPTPFFQTLATADLDWSSVHVTLTDERFVPEHSDASNSRLLRDAFFQGRAAAAQFVMPALSDTTLQQAADEWDAQIRAAPAFDLVVLGMGEDGHFASLFPGSPALTAGLDLKADRYALAAPDKSPQRLSLTLRALARTKRLAFLVSGGVKRGVIERVLRNEADSKDLPIFTLVRQSPVQPVFYWGAAS